MSLKDTWINKVDNVDDVVAEDINNIAQQVIQNEEEISQNNNEIANLQKQIEDGKKYINNNFANALKKTVTGEVIAINDASPIEHDVDVKVSSKNMLDLSKMNFNQTNTTATLVGDELTVTGYLAYVPVYGLKKGKTYTYSWTAERNSEFGGGFALEKFYADGSRKLYVYDQEHNPERSPYTFTLSDDIEYMQVYFYGGKTIADPQKRTTAIYRNVQFEEGAVATSYMPYISDLSTVVVKKYEGVISGDDASDEPESYIPDKDGKTDGIMLDGKSVTLTTDTEGVNITCTYNQDTNKVIEKLTNAIISLGGNI